MSEAPRSRPPIRGASGRWWHDAVGYEVYIRSFQDSTGSGVGDLPGIVARLDHLAGLGVGVVWVTPFYPSPMHDHGYDVADYRGVEPQFGTLADVDALIAGCHERGMRLVIDLVPNHSSSEHRWFRSALGDRESPYRDYYIWRDPAPDGGPPNNWTAHFGGRAWTLDEATGQYWLHLFLPEQPDLNWRNPALQAEFDEILEFWLFRGVDGFRIDVAHALMKDPALPDNPVVDTTSEGAEMGGTSDDWESLRHVHDVDQADVLDVYRRWRPIAERHDALLLGEVYVLEPERWRKYVADDDGLHAAFFFRGLHRSWEEQPEVLRQLARLADEVEATVGVVQGSHDRSRAATRYGGGDRGRRRALAVATVQLFLPGFPVIYQGEELGLVDGELGADDVEDPAGTRDVCRTPMPWEPGEGMGFTEPGVEPWLPFGGRSPEDTATVQGANPASWLSAYRRLLACRTSLLDPSTPLTWLPADDGPLVAFTRGEVAVLANLGDEPIEAACPSGTIRFATDLDREGAAVSASLLLAPAEAAVVAP